MKWVYKFRNGLILFGGLAILCSGIAKANSVVSSGSTSSVNRAKNIGVTISNKDSSKDSSSSWDFGPDYLPNTSSNNGFPAPVNDNLSPKVIHTNTGYSYTEDENQAQIDTPLPDNIMYADQILSGNVKKAFDLAYRTMLNYDNATNADVSFDSDGAPYVTVKYDPNWNITVKDTQLIQDYLWFNCPELYNMAQIGGTTSKSYPIYNTNGQIIGQKIYTGGNFCSGYSKNLTYGLTYLIGQ